MQFYNLKKACGIYLSLIFMLLFSACAEGQDFSRYDLSTDDGVNAARAAKLGKKLPGYSKGCIKRPKELPEIILVGTFAHDRGCMSEGAFVKKYFLSRQENLSEKALESLGWRKAGSTRREEIALKWTQFGLLAFGGYPMVKANEDFDGREFHAPESLTGEQGVVGVVLWTRRPAGMRCETGYERLSFIFAEDGSLQERKSIDNFTIPCKSFRPGRKDSKRPHARQRRGRLIHQRGRDGAGYGGARKREAFVIQNQNDETARFGNFSGR
ncbi:MAG TPA: hypothetical protein VF604_15565 [Pyrinomonadaceae bacterium]|jgi:hypothetical protein